MAVLRIPYALRNSAREDSVSQRVSPANYTKESTVKVFCPCCAEAVRGREGHVRVTRNQTVHVRSHFMHFADSQCSLSTGGLVHGERVGAKDALVHYKSKFSLGEYLAIPKSKLPIPDIVHNPSNTLLVSKAHRTAKLISSDLPIKHQPDVLAEIDGQLTAIEFVYKADIKPDQLNEYKKLGVACLVVRIPKDAETQDALEEFEVDPTFEHLRAALPQQQWTWAWHPQMEQDPLKVNQLIGDREILSGIQHALGDDFDDYEIEVKRAGDTGVTCNIKTWGGTTQLQFCWSNAAALRKVDRNDFVGELVVPRSFEENMRVHLGEDIRQIRKRWVGDEYLMLLKTENGWIGEFSDGIRFIETAKEFNPDRFTSMLNTRTGELREAPVATLQREMSEQSHYGAGFGTITSPVGADYITKSRFAVKRISAVEYRAGPHTIGFDKGDIRVKETKDGLAYSLAWPKLDALVKQFGVTIDDTDVLLNGERISLESWVGHTEDAYVAKVQKTIEHTLRAQQARKEALARREELIKEVKAHPVKMTIAGETPVEIDTLLGALIPESTIAASKTDGLKQFLEPLFMENWVKFIAGTKVKQLAQPRITFTKSGFERIVVNKVILDAKGEHVNEVNTPIDAHDIRAVTLAAQSVTPIVYYTGPDLKRRVAPLVRLDKLPQLLTNGVHYATKQNQLYGLHDSFNPQFENYTKARVGTGKQNKIKELIDWKVWVANPNQDLLKTGQELSSTVLPLL